jgi:CubicO group peptidase (beta-lactamase class C family)
MINLMKKYNVRGLGLAVVKDGKIYAQGYGVKEDGGPNVDTTTHFSAGSISKPVAALGALALVQQGKLDLDEDVNTRLKSWKYRRNRFTPWNGINLKQILSHTGGFGQSGFGGYKVGSPLPSLQQILDGAYPSNTGRITVDYPVGQSFHYSGGGFEVMEQEIEDVTGLKFEDFMSSTVLGPLGMTSSSYEQPAPPLITNDAASGYEGGKLINGKWFILPEKAAAGLWCTPSDLVKFVIHMRKAAEGQGIISANLYEKFLTIQPGGKNYGLGITVGGQGKQRYYQHGGSNNGFLADMKGFTETGDGAVIMINGNRRGEGKIFGDVYRQIGKNFGWPGY